MLGFVALALVPMPLVLYFFGKRIRGRSKFAPSPDIAQDKRRDEEARLQADGPSEIENRNQSQTETGSAGSDDPLGKEKERKEE